MSLNQIIFLIELEAFSVKKIATRKNRDHDGISFLI